MWKHKIFAILLLFIIALAVVSCGASPDADSQSALITAPATASASVTPQPTGTRVPPTMTVLVTATVSPSPSPTSLPTATALPEEYYIRDIAGHRQYFTLGCEAAVAKDWSDFYGYNINEFDFQTKLPLSDNPDKGFVGDVNAPWGQVPPYGYGVHAGPIADLLNAYGIPARAYKAYTLEQVRQKLAQNQPVIAWVIGNMVGGIPYEYTDSAGDKVLVAAYEHTIILTGYSATKIRYMTNGRFYEAPNEVFLNSWGVLGNMVVVNEAK